MTFNVWVKAPHIEHHICERIDATGVTLSPDGALIFMDSPQSPPKAIYNPRHWLKCEPAAIQTGKAN